MGRFFRNMRQPFEGMRDRNPSDRAVYRWQTFSQYKVHNHNGYLKLSKFALHLKEVLINFQNFH